MNLIKVKKYSFHRTIILNKDNYKKYILENIPDMEKYKNIADNIDNAYDTTLDKLLNTEKYKNIADNMDNVYDTALDKLLDTITSIEAKAKERNLRRYDIGVSVNIGIISISITKNIE